MNTSELPAHTRAHQCPMTDAEREQQIDEGLDYFGKMGAVHAEELQAQRDLEQLGRIEEQREQTFDVPGTTERHSHGN